MLIFLNYSMQELSRIFFGFQYSYYIFEVQIVNSIHYNFFICVSRQKNHFVTSRRHLFQCGLREHIDVLFIQRGVKNYVLMCKPF